MTQARSLALLMALGGYLTSPATSAAAGLGGLSIDLSNGQATYRYAFDLPAARGRFQPTLGLVFRSSSLGICSIASKGYGKNWALDLPTINSTPTGLFYSDQFLLPGKGGVTLASTVRDSVSLMAEIETRYLSVKTLAADTLVATDAAGNAATFKTSTPNAADAQFQLTTIVDRDGNVTKYTYVDSVYGKLLSTIQYNAYRPSDATSTGAIGDTGAYAATIALEYQSAYPVLSNVRIIVRSAAAGLTATSTARRYSIVTSGFGTIAPQLDGITAYGGESGPEQLTTSFTRDPGTTVPMAADCLATVVNPLGGRQAITYALSTTFPSSSLRTYPVVKSLTTSGPAMPTEVISYWYANQVQPTSADYRGFAESWSQNAATSIVTHFSWETSSRPFAGAPAKLEFGSPRSGSTGTPTSPPLFDVFRTVTLGHAVRRVTDGACVASAVEPSSANGDYPNIPVTTTESDVRTVDGVSLSSSVSRPCGQVDQWGNAAQVTTDPDASVSGDEVTTTNVFVVSTNSAALCKDCISTATVTAAATGSVLAKTQYDYGSTSQPTAVRRLANATDGTPTLVASWSYHGDGNVGSRTEGGAAYTYLYDDYYQLRPKQVVVADVASIETKLVTDTSYDTNGRVASVSGPYYVTTLAGVPASLRHQRYYAYDSLGRPKAIALQDFTGSAVTQALQAFTYQGWAGGSAPASATAFEFVQPTSYADPNIPQTSDVRQRIIYLDGGGQQVQSRTRLGGSASGAASASITKNLSQYLVSGGGTRDGAGRVSWAVAPYYSSGAAYVDLSAAAVDKSSGTVRATFFSYDSQGRQTCATTRVVASTLAAAQPSVGICRSSFAEDTSYAYATATIYRGLADSMDGGRRVLGIKTVEARFNASALTTGVEVFVDAAGRTRRVVDAEGNSSRYQLDLLGRAIGVAREAVGSAATIQSTSTLDLMGRSVLRSDPNFGRRRLAYDPSNPRLLTSVYFERPDAAAPGQYKVMDEIRYAYDKGRIKSVQFCQPSTGCVVDASYTWDLPYLGSAVYGYTAGQIGYASNGNTTIAMGYDDYGAPTRRDQWLPSVADSGHRDQPFRLMPIAHSGKAITGSVAPPGRSTSLASGPSSSRPSPS